MLGTSSLVIGKLVMEIQNTQTRFYKRDTAQRLLQYKASKELAVKTYFELQAEDLLQDHARDGWQAKGNDDTDSSQDQVVLTVDDNGMIRQCNSAAGMLLGCPVQKLVWRHVSSLLSQLAHTAVTKNGQINPRLRFLARIGHGFQLAVPGGRMRSAQIFISDQESYNGHFMRLIICPGHAPTQ